MAKDLDVCQILSLPVSVFIDSTKGDNPRVILVVFDQTRPLITKKKYANVVIMAASSTPKAFLDYKFTVNAVAEFQVGYKNVRNKESFLKTYVTDSRGKPSIDEQIEALVVHVLLENGLGYKSVIYGEDKYVVERALLSAVSLFKFFMNTATCSSETKGIGL